MSLVWIIDDDPIGYEDKIERGEDDHITVYDSLRDIAGIQWSPDILVIDTSACGGTPGLTSPANYAGMILGTLEKRQHSVTGIICALEGNTELVCEMIDEEGHHAEPLSKSPHQRDGSDIKKGTGWPFWPDWVESRLEELSGE